ncbi:uncharacterized protein LOC131148614 isoform X2 [Malania oleifera]|uniref:uncharacterized protein LOC131148614 isoform X2 n=1 Tax=Malania oleifera TaxID=397392 RepID=UPI0025AE43EA|nr:uncharacterized protein LOC131148614 isoform X2 [Malania oleifera]
MAKPVKGTVTPLSSIFSAEEAQKAAKRVQDAVADSQRELGRLRDFVADNTNLVNLVQRLPDELHHDIMVPFGKAAFFPGRLVHTNEFLVLLGEGYYAERTSRQTIEILKRRGKVLESHVDSLKAVMEDLKAEASFFDTTAAEAAEGLVEIREEFIEENFSGTLPNSAPPGLDTPLAEAKTARVGDEDEEYAHIMSKLEELEKEELAAENVNKDYNNGQIEADCGHTISQQSGHDSQSSEEHQLTHAPPTLKDEYRTTKDFSSENRQDLSDQLNFEGLMIQPISKDESLYGKSLAHGASNSSSSGNAFVVPEVRENVQAVSTSKNEVVLTSNYFSVLFMQAFTGSIVEHSHNIQTNSREQIAASSQASSSQPSKPVSRFKMQRK